MLVQALEVVENVKKSLTIPKFKAKLDEILEKNPGHEKLEKMGAVLSGKTVPDIAGEDPNVIASFRCASMTSVDCERAFSRFNPFTPVSTILSSKVPKMTIKLKPSISFIQNFLNMFLIYWSNSDKKKNGHW